MKKVRCEIYSEWGTLIKTLDIQLTVSKNFRQFANSKGVAISPGDKSFTTNVGNNQKVKYTLISK